MDSFDFSKILEQFKAGWKIIALVILSITLVVVVLGGKYFDTASYSCRDLIKENHLLLEDYSLLSYKFRQLLRVKDSMKFAEMEIRRETTLLVTPPKMKDKEDEILMEIDSIINK